MAFKSGSIRMLGGSLLIAATAIGVGMLGLPVATGPGGFFPAFLIYLLTWGFMLTTGLLYLEVCAWMPPGANLMTMTQKLLGPLGKAICSIVYFFLFFTAMIAHISAGGHTLIDLLKISIGYQGSQWIGMIFYVLMFSPIIYLGVSAVSRFNMVLLGAALLMYICFIILSASSVELDLLKFISWKQAWPALPVLFTAFTYQLIIPTLMSYMKQDVRKVRLAILLGSTVPLVVYLIWELFILGIIPVNDLILAKNQGYTAVMPLKKLLHNPWIFKIGTLFAFFVLTTSYCALALAFLDFLMDGLKLKHQGLQKAFLCLIVFIPPTVIAWIYPGVFITALEYTGGISCALLFGFLPPLMVWIGRYIKRYRQVPQRIPGGKPVLSILMILIFLEIVLQLTVQFKKT